MYDYEKKTKDFCIKNNIKIQMKYLGCHKNELWDEDFERDNYFIEIITPIGRMNIRFWDSLQNTLKNKERKKSGYSHKTFVTEYDVLSCLQKYDVESFEDFIFEYGYKIEEKKDFIRIQQIYNLTKKEYEDICRCFTPIQIEELKEIE